MARNDDPPEEPMAGVPCDRCGRVLPPAELQWRHGELLCDPCRLEEENCGCGDDDPAE
ncbi:MAG: hypothetical protein AB1413_07085 [Thermodesulfobacteriota bacterium]